MGLCAARSEEPDLVLAEKLRRLKFQSIQKQQEMDKQIQ